MEEYDAEALDQGAVNGPIEIEVFSAMSGSLHCKIQWPETGLRQSTDFLEDLTHRLPQGVPCKVTAWWFQYVSFVFKIPSQPGMIPILRKGVTGVTSVFFPTQEAPVSRERGDIPGR